MTGIPRLLALDDGFIESKTVGRTGMVHGPCTIVLLLFDSLRLMLPTSIVLHGIGVSHHSFPYAAHISKWFFFFSCVFYGMVLYVQNRRLLSNVKREFMSVMFVVLPSTILSC